MTVADVKRTSKALIQQNAKDTPEYRGAFLIGSLTGYPDTEQWQTNRDVDIRIVVDAADRKQLKEMGLGQQILSRDGIIFDIGFDPLERFSKPDDVLADYGYAHHFATSNVLSDPTETAPGERSDQSSKALAYFEQINLVERSLLILTTSTNTA